MTLFNKLRFGNIDGDIDIPVLTPEAYGPIFYQQKIKRKTANTGLKNYGSVKGKG